MKTERDILIEANEIIKFILEHYKNELPIDTIQAVEDYRRFDEYEMAFEGLFIDCMKENVTFIPELNKNYGSLVTI